MNYKKMMSIGLSAALSLSLLTACGGNNSAGNSGEKQVVISSNADEEAVTAMKNALDGNGYEGKYIFQTYGTSELGGRKGYKDMRAYCGHNGKRNSRCYCGGMQYTL